MNQFGKSSELVGYLILILLNSRQSARMDVVQVTLWDYFMVAMDILLVTSYWSNGNPCHHRSLCQLFSSLVSI